MQSKSENKPHRKQKTFQDLELQIKRKIEKAEFYNTGIILFIVALQTQAYKILDYR